MKGVQLELMSLGSIEGVLCQESTVKVASWGLVDIFVSEADGRMFVVSDDTVAVIPAMGSAL